MNILKFYIFMASLAVGLLLSIALFSRVNTTYEFYVDTNAQDLRNGLVPPTLAMRVTPYDIKPTDISLGASGKVVQYYAKIGNDEYGLACICDYSSNNIGWQGVGHNNTCSGGNEPNQAVALWDDTYWVDNLEQYKLPRSIILPDHACCRLDPQVGGASLNAIIADNGGTAPVCSPNN